MSTQNNPFKGMNVAELRACLQYHPRIEEWRVTVGDYTIAIFWGPNTKRFLVDLIVDHRVLYTFAKPTITEALERLWVELNRPEEH